MRCEMALPTWRVSPAWRRGRIASVLLTAVLVLSFSNPALAEGPSPPCNGLHDGELWFDEQLNKYLVCEFVPYGFGWAWRLPRKQPDQPEQGEDGAITYLDNDLGVGQYSLVGGASFSHGSFAYSRAGDGVTPLSKPAGWIAARTILNYWNGSAWVTCRDSDWSYSQFPADNWTKGLYSSSPWCGNAWYYG